MTKFFFTTLILFISTLSFGQSAGSCEVLRALRSNQKDTITVLAQTIASIKVHKGVLLRKLSAKHKLNISKITYCGQIVVEGCTDTLVLVSLDNSSFAFNAVSQNKDDLFKFRLVGFSNPLKPQGDSYLMIDKIMPSDSRR